MTRPLRHGRSHLRCNLMLRRSSRDGRVRGARLQCVGLDGLHTTAASPRLQRTLVAERRRDRQCSLRRNSRCRRRARQHAHGAVLRRGRRCAAQARLQLCDSQGARRWLRLSPRRHRLHRRKAWRRRACHHRRTLHHCRGLRLRPRHRQGSRRGERHGLRRRGGRSSSCQPCTAVETRGRRRRRRRGPSTLQAAKESSTGHVHSAGRRRDRHGRKAGLVGTTQRRLSRKHCRNCERENCWRTRESESDHDDKIGSRDVQDRSSSWLRSASMSSSSSSASATTSSASSSRPPSSPSSAASETPPKNAYAAASGAAGVS